MDSIRKINSMENKNIEYKKMQELQNKIMGQGNNIALTKGIVPDPRKRQFIKKGILGIIAGIGIAVFSKMTSGLQAIKLVDSPQVPTYGAMRLEGGTTSEATTTSTSATDLISISGLSIAGADPIQIIYNGRRLSGGTNSTAHTGLKLNTTVIGEADSTNTPATGWGHYSDDGTGHGAGSITTSAHDGMAVIWLAARVTNYTNGAQGLLSNVLSTITDPTVARMAFEVTNDAAMPTATITDVVLRAVVGNANFSMGVDGIHIYSFATS